MAWYDIFKREKRNYDPFLSHTFAVNNAGEIINSNTALQCPPYVSAVNLLSTSLAKLGKHVYKDGERVEGHPIEKLLRSPNPYINGYELFQQADLKRLNEGNIYIHITRNDKGLASQLMLINPANVSMKIENDIYYLVRQGDKQIRVEPKNMIHVKSPFMDESSLQGIGYHTILKEQLGLWITAQKHQARYFNVGSDPTSLLTTDEKLSPEKRKAVREAWEKVNSKDNKMRVAVLDGGFKFIRLGSNFSDLEMNDMFSELTKEIASAFNIDPSMVGHDGTKNTYQNVESQNMNFLQQALMPSITAWEYQLQKLFNDNSSFYIKFNYETLLRADSTSRAERLTKLVSNDIITTNEAREYEGLKAL